MPAMALSIQVHKDFWRSFFWSFFGPQTGNYAVLYICKRKRTTNKDKRATEDSSFNIELFPQSLANSNRGILRETSRRSEDELTTQS